MLSVAIVALIADDPDESDAAFAPGDTLAGLQVFVFPGLLYWKVKEKEHRAKGEVFAVPLYTWMNIFLAVFMCVCYYATL